MKETILDLHAHSMRDNLVFLRVLKQADKNPEATVKECIQKHYQSIPSRASHSTEYTTWVERSLTTSVQGDLGLVPNSLSYQEKTSHRRISGCHCYGKTLC